MAVVVAAAMGEHVAVSISLHTIQAISAPPAEALHAAGDVFARFGPETQDSGNVSYGVEVSGERFFVKTTDPDASVYLPFAERVALLRNSVELNGRCTHPLMPELLNVIESDAGPLLVYRWVDGELLRAVPGDVDSAHERFRRLPVDVIQAALDGLIELHAMLAAAGYVAVDFYDGCLIYDFARQALHVVDLDHYQRGPFANRMGRMFGSSRFMAPEEFELGAAIDQRTTVFNLGRAAAIFLGDGGLAEQGFRGSERQWREVNRACQPSSGERHQSVAEFYQAWQAAR